MSTMCDCGDHVFKTVSRRWVVMVSPADKCHLVNLRTYIRGAGYVSVWKMFRTTSGRGIKSFARLISGVQDGLLPDHINRNPLDNRRGNIRPATHSQNAANSKPQARKAPGLPKGVTQLGPSRYQAQIYVSGHRRYLGTHSTPEAAHAAYASAAVEAFGEFARAS